MAINTSLESKRKFKLSHPHFLCFLHLIFPFPRYVSRDMPYNKSNSIYTEGCLWGICPGGIPGRFLFEEGL